jgi:uncharacterized membrane protein
MTQLAKVLLSLHIAGGFTALVAGARAMLTRKGERYHLRSGRIYFWGMAVVAATALPLAILGSNIFLLAVAILSFYLAFSGYRVIVRLRRGALGRPAPLDWVATSGVLLAGAGLLAYGEVPQGSADIVKGWSGMPSGSHLVAYRFPTGRGRISSSPH